MVTEITDSNFEKEVLQANGTVLVDVSAAWCGPCKALAPVVEALSDEYKDKVKVGKLDVDKSPNVPGKYSILSVPTLLFFKNGQLIDQLIGLVSRQAIKSKLDSIL